MKHTGIIIKLAFVASLLFYAGCDSSPVSDELPPDLPNTSIPARYAPATVHILPLTEIRLDRDEPTIDVYVALIDRFGSAVKSPAIFRFELYEFIQRSAQPKGKRITIWPDIDLTDPTINNQNWRDFLRAYQFDLPIGPAASDSYILQVTCVCSSGRRISHEITLKPKN